MELYFLLLIFLLIQGSSESRDYLQRNGKTTISSSSDLPIYFNSSSFGNGDNIYFEIKAESDINQIQYLFFNDEEQVQGTFPNQINSPEASSTKTEGGKNYIIKIFKFAKSSEYKYVAITFTFAFSQNIQIRNIRYKSQISSSTDSGILKKNESITVNGYNGYAIMDTSDFKEGDEIYIKIKAIYFYDTYLYYEFTDDIRAYSSPWFEDYPSEFSTKTIYENGYEINHYTITKERLAGGRGNYLVMYFDCQGMVTITNTIENEGNNKTIIIIVSVVVVVVIIVIVLIVYYCIRKKRAQYLQTEEGNNMNYQNQNVQINQKYNNQNYGYNNNYNVQQKYNGYNN